MIKYEVTAMNRQTRDLVIAHLETDAGINELQKIIQSSPSTVFPMTSVKGEQEIIIATYANGYGYKLRTFVINF